MVDRNRFPVSEDKTLRVPGSLGRTTIYVSGSLVHTKESGSSFMCDYSLTLGSVRRDPPERTTVRCSTGSS